MGKQGNHRYDWDSIKQEYVTTDISLAALSKKLGIRKRTIDEKCRTNGWVEERKKYRQQVATMATTSLATRVAEARVEELATELTGAETLAMLCVKMMNEKGEKLRSGDLERIAKTLAITEELKRSILSIIRYQDRESIAIARERLELEKKKAEQSVVDKDITIRIDGFEREWSE